jgi:RHS repeat-associated protein
VLLTPALRRRPRWAATVVGLAAFGGSVSPAGSSVSYVQISWVHGDHLGTPLAVTDTPLSPSPPSAAKTVWRASYAAYGKATVDENPDGDTQTFTLRVRLPGQYEDGETGLHYNFLRYYDSQVGGFTSPDPIGQMDSLNVYAYALGNPILYSDPLGLTREDVRWALSFIERRQPDLEVPSTTASPFEGLTLSG